MPKFNRFSIGSFIVIGLFVVLLTGFIALLFFNDSSTSDPNDLTEFIDGQLLAETHHYNELYEQTFTSLNNEDFEAAFDYAEQASEESKRLEILYASYSIPSDLPEHIMSLFEAATSDLSVAYAVNTEAFLLLMEYIETQDSVLRDQAEDKFAEAETYIESALFRLERIKTEN
ncbi:hypothetical protein [Alkalihalobacillus pseudalcaliphilus]|uniref:hypothetical protein n=1 Tax=Alkalihalobacillus pseudalcaliphilus TaxID=79884 RepID=UPI00064DDEC4|nr:hypothetical protein [Alkalihalobacillus pseudalcaliphilus]KMK77919.1 hypothetical protein AB990_00170 [Alkalihalobacillus pseudalcaliphilus]